MGEKYCLSDKELEGYRSVIVEQLNKYKKTKSVDNLTLFLIWLYEFMEMFAVNRKNVQGKLRHAKDFYGLDIVARLFNIRGSLVHRRYGVSEDKITGFYVKNEQDLLKLMKLSEFDISTLHDKDSCTKSNAFSLD